MLGSRYNNNNKKKNKKTKNKETNKQNKNKTNKNTYFEKIWTLSAESFYMVYLIVHLYGLQSCQN